MRPPPRRIGRRVAALGLTAYATALVLSAWPSAVRPAALDPLVLGTRASLRTVGIRGGVAVFRPERERLERIVRNDCLRVRTRDRGAPPETRYPPGPCVVGGPRLRVPPTEAVLRGLHVRVPSPLNQAVVGDFFCHRGGRVPAEIEVAWTRPWVALDGGAEGVEAVALYRWRCRPPGLAAELRAPALHEIPDLGPELAPGALRPELAPGALRPELAPGALRPELAPGALRPELAPGALRPELAPGALRPELAPGALRPELAP